MPSTVTKTLSYSVVYEPAPEGGYVVTVPALPGCHTQGDSFEEAETNIREAIELYVESLLSDGEDIPREDGALQGRITVPIAMPV
jgi:predicted RNase H-like HicB family nuclease